MHSGCLPDTWYWINTFGWSFTAPSFSHLCLLLRVFSSSVLALFGPPLWLHCMQPTFTTGSSCCFPQLSNTGWVSEVWSIFKQIRTVHNSADDDKWLTWEASGAELHKDAGWFFFSDLQKTFYVKMWHFPMLHGSSFVWQQVSWVGSC